MLCIFDEAALSMGTFTLIIDAVASLARQWIVRSEFWKLAVAMIGACLQVTAGGLIWIALGHGSPSHKSTSIPNAAALDPVMRFIVASVGGIVLMVAAASLWMSSFVRTRSRGPRLAR